jgi:BolA protein
MPEAANKELTDAKSAPKRALRMENALRARFSPSALEVIDESAQHAGHAGAAPGGETHYRIRMTSAAFEGLSRLDRQRAVNAALADEFAAGLHALALELAAG